MPIKIEEGTSQIAIEDRINMIVEKTDQLFPAGIPTSLIEAEGDLIVGLSAGVGLRIPAPTVSGLALLSNLSVSGLWELGAPVTGGSVTMTNKSGSVLAAGSVVVFYADSDKAFTTTTKAGSTRVSGVLAEEIGVDESGEVAIIGVIKTVLVQGNVARFDWITTSTTAARGISAGATKPEGAVAMALTAYAGGGAGTVEALVMSEIQLGISWEDLANFTEVDPNSHIAVTSAKASGANLARNETAYVYKDYGVDYFDALDILFECRVESTTDASGLGYLGLTNTLGNVLSWAVGIKVLIYDVGGVYTIFLEVVGGTTDTYVGAADTLYYCRLERAAGNNTVTLKIYSDAARTTLLDTLSVTGAGTDKYRYLYPICSYNDSSALAWDGYYQDIILN